MKFKALLSCFFATILCSGLAAPAASADSGDVVTLDSPTQPSPTKSLANRAPDTVDSNPTSLPTILPGTQVVVGAVAHAAFIQKVTITGFPSAASVVFQGSGEGSAMTIAGSPTSATSFTQPPVSNPYVLSITFTFSSNGGSSFQMSVSIQLTSEGTLFQFFTEDSVDNDDNDTILTFSVSTS